MSNVGPAWASRWLVAAGVYNLAWGGVVIAAPGLLFDIAGLTPPRYPQIWQCVGMIVGVYGIGYLIASRSPRTHWPIVLVGFLGKVFGPIGFGVAVARGELPWAFGATIITNDLIWWVPFAMILWDAARSAGDREQAGGPARLEDVLRASRDLTGRSLAEISTERPALVLLTRHAGCTFCKEAVADFAAQLDTVTARGLAPVIVSMSDPSSLADAARRAKLDPVHWISDPDRQLYRALDVPRGTFLQLFGPIVWWRAAIATLNGHLVGRLQGDGFQMPGTFVIHRGRVVRACRARHAAQRIEFAQVACEVSA